MRGEDMAEQEKYLFRAEKICKSFGTVHALKEFDITIKAGEIRGLVGENGSGKSTFSSIVAGIQKYDSGKMYLDGHIARVSAISSGVICMKAKPFYT